MSKMSTPSLEVWRGSSNCKVTVEVKSLYVSGSPPSPALSASEYDINHVIWPLPFVRPYEGSSSGIPSPSFWLNAPVSESS